MSKVTEAVKGTLSNSKVTAIARVWIAGDREMSKAGGDLAIAICEAASDCGGNRTDALAICKQVGEARGWNDTSIGIRASMCVSFLNVGTPALKRAVKSIVEEFDSCSFDMAYEAAKAINNKVDPLKAVRAKKSKKNGAAKAKRKAGNTPSTSSSKADEAIPQVFAALLALKDLPRGFAFDIKALAAKYEYKL
jgi:hypothetical protein